MKMLLFFAFLIGVAWAQTTVESQTEANTTSYRDLATEIIENLKDSLSPDINGCYLEKVLKFRLISPYLYDITALFACDCIDSEFICSIRAVHITLGDINKSFLIDSRCREIMKKTGGKQ